MSDLNLVIDIDGVMTSGSFLYDSEGKKYKEFGPDDADALKILRDETGINILFMSADSRGFDISKKRIEDMGFKILRKNTKEKYDYIKNTLGFENTIYIGDSFVDIPICKKVKLAICPNDSDKMLWSEVRKIGWVLFRKGGERAVSEACFEILRNIYNFTEEEIMSSIYKFAGVENC